ncbi:MAG TPA: GspH/FimT family pseudopilin [Patescibacteria group bacterium]|nr:GspH/FimT family pseudopilin [Patescibacteria group bacterium]
MWLLINKASAKVSQGFTLIEMMVVVVLVGLIAGIIIPSIMNYNSIDVLQSAANDFSNTLQTAKSRAQSQYKPNTTNCVNNADGTANSLNGWQVVVKSYPVPTPGTYELDVICNGVAQALSSKTLPTSISFTNSGTFFFPVQVGGLGNAGISVPMNLIQIMSSSGNSKTATVSAGGVITLK